MEGEAASEPHTLRVCVAGFWLRSLGAVLDGLALTPVLVACALALRLALPAPGDANGEWVPWLLELLLDRHWMLLAACGFVLAVCLAYQALFLGLAGQTIGQQFLGMRVIDEQGGSPGIAAVVLRVVALPVGLFFLGLGALWIAFDREARGFHDHVSGTLVIRQSATAPSGRDASDLLAGVAGRRS